MKIKFKYGNIECEGEVETLEDINAFGRLARIAAYNMRTEDIEKSFQFYSQTATETDETHKANKNISPKVELATEGQKNYMDKVGLEYDETTTKIEAMDIIAAWKEENNIPTQYKRKIIKNDGSNN